jgi:riboflavin kinase/FMN adenylyltransferase
MKVFHALEAPELKGCALCLGNFDGVHLGHQALFAEARRHGPACVLSFHPHPGQVLQPSLAPKLLTPLPRKLELFAQYGLTAAFILPFTREYARTSPQEFEAALLDGLQAKTLVVGDDFTYGAQRAGTVTTLDAAARARGGQVVVVPPVAADGVVVHSSKVREYLLEGRVEAAQRLLGRFFDLDGKVVRGAGRGSGIGFPTANVDSENELRPAPGVYAVRVRLQGESPGPWMTGAANIGVKPTFGGSSITIEVHVLDYSGDLYNRLLRVEFVERLRAEQRFASVAELSAQIQRDVESARLAVARLDANP